jgi:hypothetical protein
MSAHTMTLVWRPTGHPNVHESVRRVPIMTTYRCFVFATFLSIAAVVSAPAVFAGQKVDGKSAAPAEEKKTTVDAAAAPANAEAGPLRLEDTDLGRMLNRDARNLPVRRAADGTTLLHIGGGFRSVMVVQIRGGAPVVACIASEKDAAAVLAPPEPAAKSSDVVKAH